MTGLADQGAVWSPGRGGRVARSSGKGDHRGAPRVPGVVSGVTVGVVFALVAAVSMTARQEPPPTVAEFAPQAVEQIKEALPEQAEAPDSDVAQGPGEAQAEESKAAAEKASEQPDRPGE